MGDLAYRVALDLRSRDTEPRISVMVPLYNYAHYVTETLSSIRQQTMAGIELIVVDDRSTDESFQVAGQWLREFQSSFARVVLAQNDANGGLPYTRNVGFSLATTEAVFPIDADNIIYPRCLERCHDTMRRHGCAVVYTIVERFGAEQALMNLAPFSPDTFRHGNQIDAMALISREAWAQVGGYDSAMRLGWEDYELWLRFCDAGLSGLQVPEILGRYRVHPQSMTKTVTSKRLAATALRRQLQSRYPWTALVRPGDDVGETAEEPAVVDGKALANTADATDEAEKPTPPGLAMEVPFKYLPKPGSQATPTVAAIVHVHYPELTAELCAYLRNLPPSANIFVSTDDPGKRASIAEAMAQWQVHAAEIRVLPNRGRDIAPKLVGFADVHDRHEFVLHLHTKKSPHIKHGVSWRKYLLEHLLGSPLIVQNIIATMQLRPDLGMVFPQHWHAIRRWIHWGGNLEAARELSQRIGVQLPSALEPDFPSGSMFWARSRALGPLLDLGLSFEDFPPEQGQTDCTLAHTIERLFLVACERAGYRWAKIAVRDLHPDPCGIMEITNPLDLNWFVSHLTRRLIDQRIDEVQSRPVAVEAA